MMETLVAEPTSLLAHTFLHAYKPAEQKAEKIVELTAQMKKVSSTQSFAWLKQV